MAERLSESWHMLSAEQVLRRLAVNKERGLTTSEALKRQEEYGKNQLKEEPRRSIWAMFFDQIKEPLILVLIAAAIISGLVGEIEDTVVIIIIVLLNAIIGLVQERKAEQSLLALRKLASPVAKVIREGHIKEVPASELVPGDLIVLEAGSNIPADSRLIEAANLKCEEAALTGESVPVDKTIQPIEVEEAALGDLENIVFASTSVTYGRGRAVVVSTGMNTQIGKIAEMIQATKDEPTPLQRRLGELGRTLGGLALLLVVIVFVAGLVRGEPLFEMFMTSISLAVAAIPEGLPSIITIVLALGVQRMIKRNAVVRKLPAVETLGTATVIASDKTGTLTQNKMTVSRIMLSDCSVEVSGQGYDPVGEFTVSGKPIERKTNTALSLLLSGASLANDAQLERKEKGYNIIGDPTEGALLVAAAKYGQDLKELTHMWMRVGELPFDSDRKRMTTLHKIPSGHGFGTLLNRDVVSFTKGGPDVVLDLCTHFVSGGKVVELSPEEKQRLLDMNVSMAEEALRVLAVAFRTWDQVPGKEQLNPENVENGLVFLGFLGMIDPPRPEAREAVKQARLAGVRPMMITGDHKATAIAIAKDLGLIGHRENALSGIELDNLADEQLRESIGNTTVFARVSPEHKVRIVDALRSQGEIVAMTGDGVNDAPALKRADIGAAMGITGTDVAKEASDMVLLDDNFATIVDAVREGRTIYANIQKAIQFLLSCNVGEIVAIFLAIVFGLGRPLTAIQILWVNLVTDGLPALALGVEPPEKGIMNRPPRDPKAGVFSGGLGLTIGLEGAMIGLLTLGGYYWALRAGRPEEIARTVAFAVLAFSQLFHTYNIRSRGESLFRINPFSNKWLNRAFLASSLLMLMVLTIPSLERVFDVVPLSLMDVEVIAALAILPIVIVELAKQAIKLVRGK